MNCFDTIWSPTISDSNWKTLQPAKNTTLRTALSCTKTTDVDHLHNETKVMKIKDRYTLLSKQFYLATKQKSHENYSILHSKSNRTMKHTLFTCYEEDTKPASLPYTTKQLRKS